MIPYEQLCEALDRYNARRRGEPLPEDNAGATDYAVATGYAETMIPEQAVGHDPGFPAPEQIISSGEDALAGTAATIPPPADHPVAMPTGEGVVDVEDSMIADQEADGDASLGGDWENVPVTGDIVDESPIDIPVSDEDGHKQ